VAEASKSTVRALKGCVVFILKLLINKVHNAYTSDRVIMKNVYIMDDLRMSEVTKDGLASFLQEVAHQKDNGFVSYFSFSQSDLEDLKKAWAGRKKEE